MKQLFTYSLIALTALLMAACASDSDEPLVPPGKPEPTTSHVTLGVGSPAIVGWHREVTSRDADDGDILANTPNSIGVWAYNDAIGGMSLSGAGEVFRNVEMFHIEGAKYAALLAEPDSWASRTPWNYPTPWAYENLMPWIAAKNYKFFAYTPFTKYENDSIEAYGKSFDAFNTIVWKHVPRFSNLDYSIANPLLQYRSADEGGNPVQVLSLSHLQSRLRFRFKLVDRYAELRYIKLKKVEITDTRGFRYTITARYNPNPATGLLEPTIVWGSETDSEVYADYTLYNDDYKPFIILSKDNNDRFQPMASLYVYPGLDLPAVKMRVTYDVYDVDDQLLRRDDTATCTIPLNLVNNTSSDPDARRLMPGYYYDVNIVVAPSFLYVLSDNDFDADGVLRLDNN